MSERLEHFELRMVTDGDGRFVRHEDHLTALRDLAKTLLADINESFPSNWLDTLLTGPDAVIPKEPPFAYGCPDVERLVQAIQKRVNGAVKLRCAELGIEIGE